MLNLLGIYIKEVLRGANNIYGYIGFIMFLGSLVITENWSHFTSLIAFTTLFYGTYSAWKNLAEKLPKKLSIRSKGVSFLPGASMGTGEIEGSLRLSLIIEVTNPGEEPVRLTQVRLLQLETDTDLLSNVPTGETLKEILSTGSHSNVLHFGRASLLLSARDTKTLNYEARFELREKDIEKIASRLHQLKEYLVKIEFEYLDLFNETHCEQIDIKRSFEQFVEYLKAHWKDTGRNDLLVRAYEQK